MTGAVNPTFVTKLCCVSAYTLPTKLHQQVIFLAGKTGLEPAYSIYAFNDRIGAGCDTSPLRILLVDNLARFHL
jgi:hypothetical protein